MEALRRRDPDQDEFHQAVYEVAAHIFDYVRDRPIYQRQQVLRRIVEPDRVISFRVCWEDDEQNIRVQRGWRVQNNNAIGPYKGGLRFHPSVNESILKFLAFEQTFKNALTGLPMGGAKGGADFDPKGKSDAEVMRFCQAFMAELYRHIGKNVDVPAGDIGVGPREIGYLFGQYKRITGEFVGVLTGKGMAYGGSPIRTEAAGYGVVYFMQHMLAAAGESIESRRCLLSGSGNVAQYAAEKIGQLGGKVVTMSDSSGFVHDPEGIGGERLAWLKALKNERRGRIDAYAKEFGATFHAGRRPWGVNAELAFPCATQNEITAEDARTMIANGIRAVSEGANMPTAQEAIHVFRDAHVLFGPGKAANAGGVAVSGLEMSQNAARLTWKEEALEARLQEIMREIHERCARYGKPEGGTHIDYVRGANVAAFLKVADAMIACGVV